MTQAATSEPDDFAWYSVASPETLAKQPNETKGKPDHVIFGTDWSTLRGHLEGRLVMLRTWRDTWWIQNWSDLAQFILPRRSIWLTQSAGGYPSPNTMTRGLEINNSILDPTGTYAARICAAGLMNGLASPSRPWFKIIPAIKTFQLDDAGRQWLDNVEDIVYTVMARSNFYNAFAQECEDVVVYGTAVNIIYEDEQDLFRCYTPCAGEYYLASGATMRVDGLYRVYVQTIAQIVDFFGLDNCSPEVQKMWAEKGGALTTERLIAHSIEPNFSITGKNVGRIKGNFAWREVYWMFGSGTDYPLAMRGYVEQPFTAGRWSTQSNDAYGRSPGMDVLPDVMQLQVETEKKGEGIEKGLNPPLIAAASLRNQPTSQLPGHVTFLEGDIGSGKGMRSVYDSQFDLNHVSADIALIQQRIRAGFFVDLFMLITQGDPNTEKTATEINAKNSERTQVLGPVIEGLISESLQPKLRRIFGILKRKKMIPPPPKSLQGVPLDIQFVSILALAQKAANTIGIESFVKMAASMKPIWPESSDIGDPSAILREYNELLGNKQSTVRSPEMVAHIQQQRQQQMEKQQQMQAAATGAKAADSAASAAATVAGIPVGSGQQGVASMIGGNAA